MDITKYLNVNEFYNNLSKVIFFLFNSMKKFTYDL